MVRREYPKLSLSWRGISTLSRCTSPAGLAILGEQRDEGGTNTIGHCGRASPVDNSGDSLDMVHLGQ